MLCSVLNEDSFQRSLNDFNLTMRDLCSLDMGRQRVGHFLYSSVGSASACCEAGPGSILGSAPQGGFSY